MSVNLLEVTRQTLLLLLPEFLILGTAIVMITIGAFVRLPRNAWSTIAAASLVAALVALFALGSLPTEIYAAVAINDALSWYARLVFVLSALVILGLAHDQVDDARAPEFFGSILIIFAGAMLVAAANDLVFLFVGLELVSIPTYLILYLPRRNATTQEAATKYFFLSIFASALALYGFAFFYGLAGVSNIKALAKLTTFIGSVPQLQLGLIAVIFILAGLGFRVAAVPFHSYAPDVYEGSPTVVAALLAWVPKAVGFVAMARLLTSVFEGDNLLASKAVSLCWIIAAVTMTLGNTVALLQNNLKRLLAYSSIAHAGYLMIGITVAFQNRPTDLPYFLGHQGIFFYLVAYALMTLGAFGVIIALDRPDRPVETVDDLAGLGWVEPWPALALGVCLFSLAGIPVTAGFWGKFYVFASAFAPGAEEDTGKLWLLAIVGVLNAAVGGYYYLRIVVMMYLRRLDASVAAPSPTRIAWPTGLAFGSCAALSLVLGFIPEPIAGAARQAAVAAVALPDPLPVTTGPVKAAVRTQAR